MLRKTGILALLLALLVTSAAAAEVTNRDMQLYGGVAVSNSTDTFFFAPMEEGVAKHWGLYKLSTASEGPVVDITSLMPARLVHADKGTVYFWGYENSERTLHTLYALDLDNGSEEELITGVASAFVGDDANSFLYVTEEEPYTLCRYNIKDRKATKVKDMSATKKAIYDATEYKGTLYFTTKDASGNENGYQYHASNNKATSMESPSPKLYQGLLYEGYRIYSNDATNSRVYAVKIGNKKGVQLGDKFTVSLNSPRFGEALYCYDNDNNRVVRCPLDGSSQTTLDMEGNALTRLVLGGSKDELFLLEDNAIYSVKPDLSSQKRLFDLTVGGQMWNYIVPAGDDAVLVMGYGAETLTHASTMMPTGVYAFDRKSGELLFGYPAFDPEDAGSDEPVEVKMPVAIGDVPTSGEDEGETVFSFGNK